MFEKIFLFDLTIILHRCNAKVLLIKYDNFLLAVDHIQITIKIAKPFNELCKFKKLILNIIQYA